MKNELYPFIKEAITSTGESVLLIGCGIGPVAEFVAELTTRFAQWSVPLETRDEPFLLDFYLARELKRDVPEQVIVLGATIKAELSHGCSGGVIGDPHMESRSINLYTEVLREGLCLAGLPGGPGLVFLGQEADGVVLMEIAEKLDRKNGGQILRRLAEEAVELGISFLLGVADGSGDREGAVLLMDGARIEVLQFLKEKG